MPRPHKIKRSKPNKISYRARPHPLTVILGVALIGALVFLGISIYQPVLDYFSNLSNRPEVSLPEELSGPEEGEGEGAQTPEEPDVPPIPDPVEGLRAVYVPTALAGDAAAFGVFLDSLSGTEINAVMVDIKDQLGSVLFNSANDDAARWGTVSETPYDLDAVAGALAQRELHLIARMSAFRDEPAARADNDNAIHYQEQDYLWLDNYADAGGKPWLNPYAPGAQGYVASLAIEAVERGAAMVVLMDYQFPDGSLDSNVGFRGYNTVSRSEVLREFADSLGEALAHQGGRLALYYPATTFAGESTNLYRFGGGPEAVVGANAQLLLGALPYQFTANYSVDGLVVEQPLANPSATLATVLQYVQARLSAEVHTAVLLQGGNESTVSGTGYTVQTIQTQIQTAAGMGVQEYVLYCTDPETYLLP